MLALMLALWAGVEVVWTAPQECPNGDEIEAWVGQLTTFATDEPLVASAIVHVRGGNYVLDLDWLRGSERVHEQLVGYDCAELGELAAVLLASELDPFAFARPDHLLVPRLDDAEPHQSKPAETETETEPEPESEPQIVAEPVETQLPRYELFPTPQPEPRRRTRPSGYLLVDGHGVVNLLPNPGGGPRLGVGLELRRARVMLAGAGWFASGFRSPTEPSVGGRLSAWSIELHGCGVPRTTRLSFPLCGQLGAGQALGTGFGVQDTLSAAQPWLWFGADAGLEWWVVPRFALRVGVGLGITPSRPSFEIVGSDARFEFPIVSGRASLGVAVRFGDVARSPRTDRRRVDKQPRP